MKRKITVEMLVDAGLNASFLAREMNVSRQFLRYALKHDKRREAVSPVLARVIKKRIKALEKIVEMLKDG